MSTHSELLQSTFCGSRLSFTWLGSAKALDVTQTSQAAAVFHAADKSISARKRLFDAKQPELKAVNSKKTEIVTAWRSVSLPYPEIGVRLLKRTNVESFIDTAASLRAELAGLVVALDNVYDDIKYDARQRLGDLFNAADYPATLLGSFNFGLDFPNLTAPEYLRDIPTVYDTESERVRAKFAQAVELAESAFLAELGDHVSRITERLTHGDDGKPKVFRDSMVANLKAFFGRFNELSIGSSAELDALVAQAQAAVSGIDAQALRDNDAARALVKSKLTDVEAAISSAMLAKPSRVIKFSKPNAEQAAAPSVTDAALSYAYGG